MGRLDSIVARATIVALLAVAAQARSAAAADLRQVAVISIPGEAMQAVGAILVDPAIHRAFLADPSNKSIDVIDTSANKFVARIGGFVGRAKSGSASGPQGLVVVDDDKQLWATDGDSSVKVIDLAAGKIVATIATGGKKRTGELAYDPVDDIALVTNPDDATQFATLISTGPDHRIRAKIVFPQAAEGIERSAYSPQMDRFYVPIPSLDKARVAGGVAEIDPRLGKVIALHRTPGCNPHSVQVMARNRLYIGCNFGSSGPNGPKGQLAVFDLRSDRIVATGKGLGGDGQTAIDLSLGQYYAAANKDPDGPVLKVINLTDLHEIQKIPTWSGSHSVALDAGSHRVYLPAAAGAAPCGGCVVVFAPGG
jgi:DNA-binding beta-propeller fold protein YncE